MDGVINRFLPDGYGFITTEDGKNIYFNSRSLQLRGLKVVFDLTTRDNGACWAENLHFLLGDGSSTAPVLSRPIGVVKRFENGWGFIRRDGEEDDLFVHYSDIAGTGFKQLNIGDVVEFTLTEGERGLCASNVVVVKPTIPIRAVVDQLPKPYLRPKAARPHMANPEPQPSEPVSIAPTPTSSPTRSRPVLPLLTHDELAELRGTGKKQDYPARKTTKKDKQKQGRT